MEWINLTPDSNPLQDLLNIIKNPSGSIKDRVFLEKICKY